MAERDAALLGRIALCIERGKADAPSPYPPDLAGEEGADELARRALEAGAAPEEVMRRGLVAGMERVGRLFRDGEFFLPDVLMSARAMTAALEHLKPHFLSGRVRHKGKVVMGTVTGDIHDIGKKVVSLFLQGAGWEVVDLGVDVPAEKFLAAVAEHRPRAVGLSALLTTTMAHMEDITRAIKTRHPDVLVLVGGAPVTRDFAEHIGADGTSPDPQGAVELLEM
ncbi:MAG: cobalamin-binding protein [Candidatus Aminicenantes bacterium RBG_13_63_10]|nr:MAG: cobalamin-binding protein [Candidatus Aminicenantes bacterium RBG_13_63_10]